jgi:hypothetical protein
MRGVAGPRVPGLKRISGWGHTCVPVIKPVEDGMAAHGCIGSSRPEGFALADIAWPG